MFIQSFIILKIINSKDFFNVFYTFYAGGFNGF